MDDLNVRKVFVKGLNNCTMRRRNLDDYRAFLLDNGHEIVDDPADSDVILVWTCAFRTDVRDFSMEQLKQYDEVYTAEVLAAGCMPDISPDILAKEFNGRLIPWKRDGEELENFFGKPNRPFGQVTHIRAEQPLCEDAAHHRATNPGSDVTFQDQFVKLVVAEGCEFKCSYCTERLAFPPYRSFPIEALVASCKTQVEESGCLNVILTADSVGQYGRDIGQTLPDLIRALKEIHPSLTIALNNLNLYNFIQYFDAMTEFIDQGWIRHLNLPIQSAAPAVLKRMVRACNLEDMERVFTLLNEKGFKEFDTHLIVGFPGETEADVGATIQFILRHRPKYVLISKYMNATGAPSHQLPDKIDDATAFHRISRAEQAFKKFGIICNSEKGAIVHDRLQRQSAMAACG